ncbi:MAG TPA: hypothetical protein VHI31_04115, partial [Actinomycetota bacterium]|nr:hypothetical protein [Actinomycetota bacterium]
GFNRPSSRQEADEWRNAWRTWEHTFIWGTGLGPFFDHPWAEFQKIVRMGTSSAREIPEHTWDGMQEKIRPSYRLAAVEHLLDLGGPQPGFSEAVNQKAEEHYVALRLEGTRFLYSTSEEIEEEVVRPAVVLLANPRYEVVQAAYLQAHKLAMAGEFREAIQAAVKALEAMLKVLGCEGADLRAMAYEAGRKGVPAQVVGLIQQLEGLRAPVEEGAEPAGAEEAMLAIHQTAVVIKYLQRRLR